MGKKLVLALALLSLISPLISATNVICYHGTWSEYRTGNGQLSVKDVPAQYCTHYIYTFVGLDAATNKVKLLDSWLDIDKKGLENAVGLKSVNPNLKVLIAVGGWGEGSAKYSAMAADSTARATFIQSAYDLIKEYGFDGFDLDWEYPARRDSTNSADKENFASLVKEFYEKFNPEGLILTAAVSAAPNTLDISYDVPTLSLYLDSINVMTYDFHGAWDTFTGHNSPLYSTSRLAGTEYADYSVDASIHAWIERGADPAKLALGLAFYGRTNILSDASKTAPGSAATATGAEAGPYTATAGLWGYNEIVEKFAENGWTQVWDDEQQVPYAFNGNKWLSYDNPESIALKVSYAKSMGLGVIVWSIETDDLHAVSGTQYALLKAINETVGTSALQSAALQISNSSDTSSNSSDSDNKSSTSSSTTTTTTSKTTTTTVSSSSSTTCTAEGYIRDSSDCNTYYYCQAYNGAYLMLPFKCMSGLYYDPTSGVCNYADQVDC